MDFVPDAMSHRQKIKVVFGDAPPISSLRQSPTSFAIEEQSSKCVHEYTSDVSGVDIDLSATDDSDDIPDIVHEADRLLESADVCGKRSPHAVTPSIDQLLSTLGGGLSQRVVTASGHGHAIQPIAPQGQDPVFQGPVVVASSSGDGPPPPQLPHGHGGSGPPPPPPPGQQPPPVPPVTAVPVPHGPPPAPFTPVDTVSRTLSHRITAANSRIVKRVVKLFRQLLSLTASEWRLSVLHEEGKCPRSLQVTLPDLHIQTIGRVDAPSAAITAMRDQLSGTLFDQLRQQTSTELASVRQSFFDALPRPTTPEFEAWLHLVLEMDTPFGDYPDFHDADSLAHARVAFNSQLRQGYSRLLWDVRQALIRTTLQMQRRSFAIRRWFHRNDPPSDQDQPMEPEQTQTERQMASLQRQFDRLRTAHSALQQTVSDLHSQQRSRRSKNGPGASGGAGPSQTKGKKQNQSSGQQGQQQKKKKNNNDNRRQNRSRRNRN